MLGRYVAVVNGELVAMGESAGEIEKITREKYHGIIPSVLLVPGEEDFTCLL